MRCESPTFELPGEAASDKALPGAPHFCASIIRPSVLQLGGAKCSPAERHQVARVWSPLAASVVCEQSAALRTSGAGSFQAVTPLPPQAPLEESRPSTPRYGFAVFIPACYSSTPLPGRIPPEVFRAGRRQPFRLLAQRVLNNIKIRKLSRKYTLRRWGSAWLRFDRPTFVRASGPSRPRPRRQRR